MCLILAKLHDIGIKALAIIMAFWLQTLIKSNEVEIERNYRETELLQV